MITGLDRVFLNYSASFITNLPFSHAHRFVYRNQFFWLALFLLLNFYGLYFNNNDNNKYKYNTNNNINNNTNNHY